MSTTFSDFLTDVPQASGPDQRRPRRSLAEAAGGASGRPSDILVTEGPRGYSVRASVFVRHALYALTVIACSLLTQAMVATLPSVNNGGEWMLFASALIVGTASVGAMFYTNHRNEILEQAKHFLFGIVLFPGTGLAILMWATRGVTQSQTSSNVLTTALTSALPLVFFATIIIPALIFIKVVAGMRHLHRTRLDDEEQVKLWTRQDTLMR